MRTIPRLTDLEQQICKLLVTVAAEINARNSSQARPVTLRIAGGWVRDKVQEQKWTGCKLRPMQLLGSESDDIDVALDNIMGFEFANAVNAWMKQQGLVTGGVARISRNPEQSKHLETAHLKVYNQPIDFVNLRTERYCEGSRIPVMEYGTPEEDAIRRDITINSLFYNLHTNQVEDFTKHGLRDLERGHIRTPMPPKETFIDDPLRILRVLRFASRFNFTIEDDIREACEDLNIRHSFRTKISRERVGIELDKMLKGPHPLKSIELIHDYGFFSEIFSVPESKLPATETIDVTLSLSVAKALDVLLRSESLSTVVPAACLLPFGGRTYAEKNKTLSITKYIVLSSVKRNNFQYSTEDADWCVKIVDSAPVIQLGKFVRQLGLSQTGVRSLGGKWYLAFIFALACEMSSIAVDAVPDIVHNYAALSFEIHRNNLDNAHDTKHLLNGSEVMALLNIASGPKIKGFLDRVMEWQLENPNITRAECEEKVKALNAHREG
ncbi:CCA tRNA nucleotidyltransferase, mitochondrial [Irineochytrium annulatum]|nr:CCA tRNA nucleotidyltransferase, mitochondrial [Irineochytrium annulatum]